MEENTTNIASSAQDVNSPETVEQAPVETTEAPEVSKEQEIENNKTIALKKERELRKEYEAKLAEYEKVEKERLEKEKMKKGKYEEVIAEKNTALETLKAQLEESQSYKDKWTTYMDNQVNDLLGKIPEGKKDFVKEVIEWKDFDAKVRLLQGFADDYKTYNPSPSNVTSQQPMAQQAPANAKSALDMIAKSMLG